ncbi:MAG: hypothetical protein N2747_00275 [Chitinophagaceae bacterium]|nr:hypothetical protein [Chitinophagaceae bacterium]
MKNLTNAQQMIIFREEIKQEICLVLNISPRQYHEFQTAVAKSYVLLMTPEGAEAVHKILNSDIYWAWWKINWAVRDEDWLKNHFSMEINPRGNLIGGMHTDAYYYWQITHDVHHLASQLSEYGVLFKKSFEQLKRFIHV